MQWNGALVGRERDDVAGGGFELGFDDGDVRLYGKADLREFFDQGTLKALATTEGGLVANESGHPSAADFVFLKDGKKHKVVGLLVGKAEGLLVFNLPIHLAFIVSSSSFPPSTPVRRTAAAKSLQDRLGFRTRRRGDIVAYLHCEEGEETPVVAVYGVIYLPETDTEQGRKFLVLYERESTVFFLGTWTAWRRVPNLAKCTVDNFNCDDDKHVDTMADEPITAMVSEFDTACVLLTGSVAKAVALAAEPPPSLKLQRAEDARASKEEQAKERREQRAAISKAKRLKQPSAPRARAQPTDPSTRKSPPSQPSPRHSPPRHPPTRNSAPSSPPPRAPAQQDTPPSMVQLKRALCGLKQAQAVEATAERARQMGELQYDLDRREAKRNRMAR